MFVFVSAILLPVPEPGKAISETEAVGHFIVASKIETVKNTRPANMVFRSVQLSYMNEDRPQFRYSLTDNGEKIRISIKVGTCAATVTNPIVLGREPIYYFDLTKPDPKDYSECGENAGEEAVKIFEEIALSFPKAYQAFRASAIKMFGPSEKRCIEFRFGYHGDVCVTYSEE